LIGGGKQSDRAPEVARLLPLLAGLAIGSGLSVFLLDWVAILPCVTRFRFTAATNAAAVNLSNGLLVIVLLPLLVLCWERVSLHSAGIYPPRFKDVAVGVAAYICLSLVQSLQPHLYQLLGSAMGYPYGGEHAAEVAQMQLGMLSRVPIPLMVAVIVVAALAEDLGTRAYPIERIVTLTHNRILAVACAFGLSLGIHIPFWGMRYTALIAPGELLLTLLYLWQRRLAPCFIAHVLYNVFPLRINLTFRSAA
jgi:membrane protease YdiL (CAAX protease family)